MSILSWLASFLRIAPKTPIKVLPKVFVRALAREPQKFNIVWFRLRFINNSHFVAEITNIATEFETTFYFCDSLFYADSPESLIDLDTINELPLIVEPGKTAEICICASGIPIDAVFTLRPKSHHDANPYYVLVIM